MNRLYWTTTALIAAECVGGGIADLLRTPPFYPVMIDLGYPPYLATIMGTAKLIAAAVVVAPGLPRLKEWAYAGITVNLVGAIASHVAMHQSLSDVIAPGAFLVLTLASWATRPPARMLGRLGAGRTGSDAAPGGPRPVAAQRPPG
jgi:hypothetical protein